MSYQYSNGLCREALRRLATNDKFETRLARAISEMGVSVYGDTSDEIWKEWRELEDRYHEVSRRIYRDHSQIITDEDERDLRDIQEKLVSIICEWIEFNIRQIAKGRLSRKAVSQ